MTATPNLEALWAGPFGDAYTERNRDVGAGRDAFWQSIQNLTAARTWLEVGCNVGANLRCVPTGKLFGVDVNREALTIASEVALAQVVVASEVALPFDLESFDLVFTCGLLIHIQRDRLKVVMGELARVAHDWVLLMEYDASGEKVISWCGQEAALWKAPYGWLFQEYVPWFRLQNKGFLPPLAGFDNVTWWLFRRKG